MTPFDFINDITSKKEYLILSETDEAEYNAYLANRGLSQFLDTCLPANEMNQRHFLDKKMQYDYLFHAVRAKKRFSKWAKADPNDNIDLLVKYYGYSHSKARQILPLISKETLEQIQEYLSEGGTKNK